MTEQDFIDKMVELMDTEEEISMDSALEEIEEWDSLSYVSFLAMARARGGGNISPKNVKEAKTIGDLYRLLVGDK